MISKRNKFKAIKTKVDGHIFDSKKEAGRYIQLKQLQSIGVISSLELQPQIPLMVNGVKIGKYIGDFRYIENCKVIIEDVKSKATMTPTYRLKKRILQTYNPPIEIRETF